MIELKKLMEPLLEGLPIKVKSQTVIEINGFEWHRNEIKSYADNERHSVAERIGYRVILALMDKFEEPKKPEVGGSAPPYCVEHNCQMILSVYNRPGSPPGNGWSCPECANERESKAVEKPMWEPGMLVEHFDENGNRTQFLVEAVGGRYLHDRHGSSYFIGNCRHVPAPKEAKPDPFQGPQVSDQTLWELAQKWRKLSETLVAEPGVLTTYELCASQAEQWARERAAQWTQNAQDYGQRNQRENEIAWAVTEAHVDDLGVPEER